MTNTNRQLKYWETPHGFRSCLHPVVACFAQQRIAFLGQFVEFSEIKLALDVGCGNGFSTYYMNEIFETWGVDLSWMMLSDHPLRNSATLTRATIQYLPFPTRAFDLVYGWEILHHLPSPEQAVKEMARISKRYIVVAEPNRNNPIQFIFSIIDREHRWVQKYSLGYMRSLFNDEGIKILYSTSGGWIFPNITPPWLLSFLSRIPYESFLGISNWVIGMKE